MNVNKRINDWARECVNKWHLKEKKTLLLLRVLCDIPSTRVKVSLSKCCSLLNTSSCQRPFRMKQTERECTANLGDRIMETSYMKKVEAKTHDVILSCVENSPLNSPRWVRNMPKKVRDQTQESHSK